MALDKLVAMDEISVTTAADTNWVQDSTVIPLDNSSGVVPKNIKTIFLEGSVIASTTTKIFGCILLVTAKDAAVPSFAGNDATMISQLEKYKDMIWATQFGYAPASDFEDTHQITMEPSTGRTLEPGQKLVVITLARCAGNATPAANALWACYDWNIWFTYG